MQKHVVIRNNALDDAQRDFGWNHTDILDAIGKLRPKHFYKTEKSHITPAEVIDYYKARKIKGENVYTHFYVDTTTGILVINSFKELKE